jgi:hypothetical protein
MFFVHSDFPEDAIKYLHTVANQFKEKNIFVASDSQLGEQIGKLKKICFLNSAEALIRHLSSSENSDFN